MNNFLLFAHYPGEIYGGWADFDKDFDTLDDAIKRATEINASYDYHIVSLKHMEIVKEGRRRSLLKENETK